MTCDDLWKLAHQIRERSAGIRRVVITIEHDNGATLSIEDRAPGVTSAAPAIPADGTAGDPLADLPWTGS